MAGKKPDRDLSKEGDTDFAQVFKDLAKGERTASALENHLTTLESKIDALLASVDGKTDDDTSITAPSKSPNEKALRKVDEEGS